MNLSLNALKAIYAPETGDYPIMLVKVEHPELPYQLYFSSDATTRLPSLTNDENVVYGTVSNGTEYMYLSMELDIWTEEDDIAPYTRLTLPNIGREMVEAVRAVSASPTVGLAVVLASDTDNIEGQADGFKFFDIDINPATVSGDLVLDIMINEPAPYLLFTPSTAPGIFK
jgi:hypothetical protein